MTTVLCPTRLHEIRVLPSQALATCPLCRTTTPVATLAAPDPRLCACGHRRADHGRYHGYIHTCPLSTCTCTAKPKEKPMITEDNMSHYQTAVANQAEADLQANSEDVVTDSYRSATVSALLALVDQARAQTAAIRELTEAVKNSTATRTLHVKTENIPTYH